ncbi:MAG TPA: carboxypeptidase regulatory-like domain-containing protein [Casimicrobiaceae bacterium]|nr:carboxypeptidase regulatory-like domain-containing protein [Casimicrobiaceae bacterium]
MRQAKPGLAGVLGLAAIAALPARAMMNPEMNPELPPTLRSGAVKYMSGGISNDQQSAMERDASGYPLELRFLAGGRVYGPAYVPVKIRNPAGKVILDATSDGPLMLADLPDGHYTVSARHAGRTETLDANVEHGKRETLAFDWK